MSAQTALVWLTRPGLAAFLVVVVGVFCLAGVIPVESATMAGCDGHEAGAKLCAQPGPSTPLPGVLAQVALVTPSLSPAVWLARSSPPLPALRFHAAPSTPRAPPFVLA